MQRVLVFSLLAGTAVVLASIGSLSPYRQAAQDAHGSGSIGTLAFDLDVSGNTNTNIGAGTAGIDSGDIQSCASVAPGGTVTLDIVVDEIPATDPAVLWTGTVTYDDSSLSVTAVSPTGLAFKIPPNFFNQTDAVPDTGANGAVDPGFFVLTTVDTAASTTGPGAMARLTITAAQGGNPAAPGLYGLSFGQGGLIDSFIADRSGAIPITNLGTATIAVGQACAEVSPQPTVSEPTGTTPDTDTDGDGLSEPTGTTPDTDTDGDGLSDADEATLGTDPLNPDSDGDGLSDGDEAVLSTDPLNPDSDGDGQSDGDEIAGGSDPLDDTSSAPNGGPDTSVGPQDADGDDGGPPWLAIIVGVAIAVAAGGSAAAIAYRRWWRPRARP